MKFAVIGRTGWLLHSAERLISAGHELRMVLTAPAAPEYETREADFEALARNCGVPFRNTTKINTPETLHWIRSCGVIDLAVSINYSGVLGGEVIGLFPGGVLNLHGGDLPRFRGNACQAWALLQGEQRIGLCVHKMVPGELDSGAIVAKSYFPIDVNTRIGDVYEWIGTKGPELMEKAVTLLNGDRDWCLERQSKDPHVSLRCFPRRPEDGRIDWKSSATAIVRLVNASSEPYAGAFTTIEGRRLIVWRAYVGVIEYPYLAVPGQVIEKVGRHGGVVVAAGEGAVELTEVDEGPGRTSPTAALRSIRCRLS